MSFEMYTRTDISTVLPHDIILRRARKPQKSRRTQKNGDIGACDTTRFFSPQSRPIFRPSERILSLSLFSFLHHLLHPVPSPLGCLFGTGTGRWVLHFALALLLQVPGPLRTRARARASKRERESENTARCVTMPGHSWHCYRYCYYYRYCCRLRPSGEWESRGPMSQLLRRVLH